ncbi:hypothetical protein BC332_34911 [Capsicum chinense]|nr:hypothetical protein BC332_34911 [Capsicum chinense]
MWPRTEEERRRQRNCGFVAFMNRADAQAAKDEMEDAYELFIRFLVLDHVDFTFLFKHRVIGSSMTTGQ